MSEEKRDSAYWKKRFKELERAQHERGRVCYEDIEKMYRRAQNELEKEISKWYGRFARNNMVSMTDARKMLTGREIEELRWDVSEYIAHGEENAVSGAWIKQLENASARYHVSRLEALKLQTQQQLEVLFGNQLDRIDTAMKDIYTSGYYKTAFELQKGVGVGWNFATLDDKTISKVISKPWAVDGRNFSERIWKSKEKLINEMHKTLTQNIILGQDPQKAINTIAERMKVSKVNAGRLVMTEEAFFSSAAQKECFAELDVEEFEVVATLDSHTSQLCRDMDGKHFPMSQYEIGVTAPPFHVNCRSTTCPYFNDEFSNLGKRAARGEDGKTYFVPANMTYREWEKSLQEIKPNTRSMDVNVHSEDNTVKETKVKTPDIKFSTKQGSTITAKQKFEDTVTVTSAYNDLPIKVQRQFSGIKFEFGYAGSACDIKNRTIRVGIGAAKEEIFHEVGHLIENYMLDSDTVREYKEYLVEGLTYSDIIKEIYYNTSGNGSEIFLIKGSRFESEYQSRLYVNIALEAINGDGTINIDFLAETISEAFRKYMNGEELSDKVKKIIEDVVL